MRLAWTALAAMLALASVAHADPATQRGAELAAEGSQHYKRGEFEVSAALLRQAYALSPEPNMLYNLGRALEGMNDITGAIEAYEGYLEHAKVIDDRGAIEHRVATLRIQRSGQAPRTPLSPAADLPEPAPPPRRIVTPKPEPAPPPIAVVETEPSAMPWVVIAAGAVIAGAGGVYGGLAINAHDEAKREQQGQQAQIYQSDAQTDARNANIGLAVGGGVFVVGLVWEIIERHSHHSAHRTIRPGISAHGVALEWTFP